ncbi:hypothetical protein FGIG_07467 [Fasciola gigantica]|uniref:Uncharacterized protein n=1 Tax=Fasciola gigantica TaxID=46835 RepID=A0A504Z4Z8_FASGI|nr:hypothetical protein FGIG_07467 [Fasciola gigantica]
MAKASLRRRINKAKAQKCATSKPPKLQNIDPELSKPITCTDKDGFQLVLTKKEKALMKKAQMEEYCENIPHRMDSEDTEITDTAVGCGENRSVIYSDDGLDTQSTVSKSWVRKKLKQTHAGGISRPSCKKRQRDIFRRVLLHTHLQLHSQPNAHGQVEKHIQSGHPNASSVSPIGNISATVGEDQTVNCTRLVSQWAQFSILNAPKIGRGNKMKKKKIVGEQSDVQGEAKKPDIKPEAVIPFRNRATATNHAIDAFRTMLQKF